ncbi:hypothetical protein ACHMWN_12330 [Pedobacter sp. UC225_61]|uniref:hypothetical protein n=1 Tax=Pedobacter sp. UC225_61 TaxID=3374623 RepID=UPI0037950BC4
MSQYKLVPEQLHGSEMNARSETIVPNIEQAVTFYQLVKLRLFEVSNWDRVCGTSATTFQLTLPDGSPSFRLEVGNLIRIDIPGPGTSAGDGYDWVRIEQIDKNEGAELDEWTGFTVRPCSNPFHPELGVAHFFSDVATSTFIVGRSGQTVWAEMHGRNEVPNGTTEKIFDGLRNAMVGWTAKVGLSYPQWKLLVDGLVKKDD